MRITRTPQFNGTGPQIIPSTLAPDGDARPYMSLPLASEVWRVVAPGHVQRWVKVKDNKNDSDWRIAEGRICLTLTKPLFTDVTTTGTYATGLVIPAGALVDPFILTTTTAWSGDTSAELDVGDGTDGDRFNSATAPSIFATGVVSGGTPSGVNPVATAATLTITITSTADFTNVAAGVTVLSLRYRT